MQKLPSPCQRLLDAKAAATLFLSHRGLLVYATVSFSFNSFTNLNLYSYSLLPFPQPLCFSLFGMLLKS